MLIFSRVVPRIAPWVRFGRFGVGPPFPVAFGCAFPSAISLKSVLGTGTAGGLRPESPCESGLCLLHYGQPVRLWWNWQTRYFEVVVGQPVQVQVLLSAPFFKIQEV
jgi:hypothetical protein